MKNLRTAIRLLRATPGATLDIFGPIDDAGYWAECRAEFERDGLARRVKYHGVADPSEATSILSAYDFLLLPTLGESFGHVIAEALVAGTPVVLSDRTPWQEVQRRGAGWCIPLDEDGQWRETLAACVRMDGSDHEAMRRAARELGVSRATSEEAIDANRALFQGSRCRMRSLEVPD